MPASTLLKAAIRGATALRAASKAGKLTSQAKKAKNSTDRMKARTTGSQNRPSKAVVGNAQAVAKRFDAEKARRTPGMNSTERLKSRKARK